MGGAKQLDAEKGQCSEERNRAGRGAKHREGCYSRRERWFLRVREIVGMDTEAQYISCDG
jgi:hypothetical protein